MSSQTETSSPPRSLDLLRRMVKDYARPHLKVMMYALVCMCMTALATAFLAKQVQPIIDDIFTQKDRERLFQIAVLVLGTFFIKGIASYGESVFLNQIGLRIVRQIQKQLADHFIQSDMASFQKIPSGEMISRIMNDGWFLRNSITKGLLCICRDTVSLFSLLSVMIYQDKLLFTLSIIVFPLAIAPIVHIGRKMRRVSGAMQEHVAHFTHFLNQMFHAIRVIKCYGRESYEMRRTHHLIDGFYRLNNQNARVISASHPIMETLGGIAIVSVICYGGLRVIGGHQSAGAFFSFITALLMAYEPMKRLAQLNASVQEGLAAAQRIFTVLNVKPQIVDAPDAKPLKKIKGSLAFENVSFHYNGHKEVLKEVQLRLEPGKVTALVGLSGAGKSTLLNLIPRFFDPTQGCITLNGQDIRTFKIGDLRSHIAMISQETILFDMPIWDNILYGRMEATDEEVLQAARDAFVDEFVQDLPQKYKTPVGEHGVRLSGGQRQRLAIARAFLKNAPIVLMDEATSALDSASEHKVHEAFDRLMKDRTTLVIAHRLSTIMHADHIYVMDQGRVVEHGQHQELVELGGHYAKLCRAQFKMTSMA